MIQPTLTMFSSKPLDEKAKKKVAGYARVSTDKDEQFTSYSAQKDYYTRFIKAHEDWEFVDLYADEGISGTHTKNRDGFNRMMEDALSGKIDLILTKSVSRFARNTVDSLTAIRKLKDHGVEVFFEKENLWTLDSKVELLLSIMSSLAQEESRSISENVKWGWRRAFEDGKVSLAYSNFLGYDKGPDGKLQINPEQAKIVRWIYDQFLEGRSINSIYLELKITGPKKPYGNGIWSFNNIRSILMNEKYTGNAYLQKTFKTDLLAKRQINNGEVMKYYVRGSHEAIVSQEEFDIVQEELKRRGAKLSGKTVCKSVFSDRVICGDCGSSFGPKLWHASDKYRTTVWQCNNKFNKNKTKCTTPHLTEEKLKAIVLKAVNHISSSRDTVEEDLTYVRDHILDSSGLEKKLKEAMEKLDEIDILINSMVGGSPLKDGDRIDRLLERHEAAEKRVSVLNAELDDMKVRKIKITRFIADLAVLDPLYQEFSDNLVRGLIDNITVYSKSMIVVTFKSGYEFTTDCY